MSSRIAWRAFLLTSVLPFAFCATALGETPVPSPAELVGLSGPLARAITREAVRFAAASEPTTQAVGGVDHPGPRSFAELRERIKPGDRIFVVDREGRETSGTLTRLSPTSLVVLVNGGEREIQSTETGRIEKVDPVWDGAVIGAVPAAIVFMGGAGASCSPHCAATVTGAAIFGGALGAFLGARIDRSFEGRTLLYGTRPDAPHTLRPGSPVTSSADLWMKVRSGDTVYVLGTTGQRTTGTFARASASSIVLLTDGRLLQEIPASGVQQVERRGNRRDIGALTGAGILAVGCLINARYGDGECRRDPIGSAILAVGGGAIVGRLIPRRTVVYRHADAGANPSLARVPQIVPIIEWDRKGVALAFTF